MPNIYFVSHCVLNTCSKTIHDMSEDYVIEEKRRTNFIIQTVKNNDALIQLPCPEFLQYGAIRWGHARKQFDNPFFRSACETMLQPYILQISEYLNYPEVFPEVIIVGINGSPSCGIDFSFDGEGWGGEFSGGQPIEQRLSTGFLNNKMGVFMEVLKEMLKNNNIQIKFVSI